MSLSTGIGESLDPRGSPLIQLAEGNQICNYLLPVVRSSQIVRHVTGKADINVWFDFIPNAETKRN